MKLFNPVTLTMIFFGAAMVGIVLWLQPSRTPPPLGSLVSMQAADGPLPLPPDGRPRHRLHLFSPWQLATIPPAPRFDQPTGALTHIARPFGGIPGQDDFHPGVDLDGIGGGNTDLGDPVFASADGLVVYAGQPTPEQGKTVVLAHRTADGRVLQTTYAHLSRIDVAHGGVVARGQTIGRVGSGAGRHAAHLHFEARHADGVVREEASSPAGLLDPIALIDDLRGAPEDRPGPSMLPAALEKSAAWNQLEIENAGRLGEILGQ